MIIWGNDEQCSKSANDANGDSPGLHGYLRETQIEVVYDWRFADRGTASQGVHPVG